MERLGFFLPSLTYPMGLNQKVAVPWNKVWASSAPVQHCSIQMTHPLTLISCFEMAQNGKKKQNKNINDAEKNTRGRAELGVHRAPQSLRRASHLLVPPSLPLTGVTQGTETCSFTALFPITHPAPGTALPARISKKPPWLSQGHLGGTKPPCKGGELPGFPSWGTAPAQCPHQSHSSRVPASSPEPSLSPHFPGTDTAWGTGRKSRVYCHFYLDLHNSVTASDIKSNVRSQRTCQGQGAQEHGLAPPPQGVRAQPGLWLCPVVSADPPSAAAWFCHVGCQRGVNLSPPWCHLQ